MAVQKAVAERWKQVTGTPLIEGYGLTETAPSATANPLDLQRVQRHHRRADASTEVELRDDDDSDVRSASRGKSASAAPR